MRRWLFVLVGLLTLTQTASAQRFFYNGTISVTSTNSVVAFIDNGSGGTGQQFTARHVLVVSAAASANLCYFDLKDTTATTADIAVPVGAGLSFEFDQSSFPSGQDGWSGLGAICAAAETATFYVTASR